jgi:hypothetical protein
MNDGRVQNWRRISIEFAVTRFDVEVHPATKKVTTDGQRRTASSKKEERKQI